ncbi:hypothetical protein [Vibrio sp. Sgm 5]|uniref:hypothetical protein n=1 Tax=Vibrio sp. Sgm 5 TaxID=2994387 RepID=UPI0022487E5F|nr:hypothetical protein [Vibrio sp. Sgm 5]MCX2791358.1 hypothetical protein [Vibrio sp. Sgm 5]
METVFTFDWEKVYTTVKDGLASGDVTLRDGVAYWTEQSGKSGIVQHMPLKEVILESEKAGNLAALIQSSHATQLAAIGLSTTIIVGAIVVQTMYLAKKIDKLQQTIDVISEDIDAQNILFYLNKLSRYFGTVESARVILLDKMLVSETRDIAPTLITELAVQRNEVLALIDNLIAFADKATERHLEHMLEFITLMMDIMPKAIYIESQLCDRFEKFRLSEHLMRESGKRYNHTLQDFRTWCNSKAKTAISGTNDPIAIAFHEKRSMLLDLFNAEHNQLLLQELKTPSLQHVTR